MKFMVDAQLPKLLSAFLNSKGFDAVHTLDLPNQNNSQDDEVILFADNENRIVISKDSDFLVSFLIMGKPHKLLLVSTGNIKNKELLSVFDKNLIAISEIFKRSNLLEITEFELIEY